MAGRYALLKSPELLELYHKKEEEFGSRVDDLKAVARQEGFLAGQASVSSCGIQ